jgi:hypothetical protein
MSRAYRCPHRRVVEHRDGSVHCESCSTEWPRRAELAAELTERGLDGTTIVREPGASTGVPPRMMT